MTTTTDPAPPSGSEMTGFCTVEDITLKFGLFDTTKQCPVSFRLYIDEKEVARGKDVRRNRRLHWGIHPSFYVRSGSRFKMSIRGNYVLFKLSLAKIEFPGQCLLLAESGSHDGKEEYTVLDKKANVSVKFRYTIGSAACTNELHRGRMDCRQSILDRLGRYRATLDSLIKVGGAIAEVTPLTKAVFSFIEKTYDHLKQQAECDTIVSDIVDCITNILPSIQAAQKHAHNIHLHDIIPKMLNLIGHASNFVEEYSLDGAAVHALRALSSSTARDQIDKFTNQFMVLKDCFDRAVQCHILDVVVETRELITTRFDVIQRAFEIRGHLIYAPVGSGIAFIDARERQCILPLEVFATAEDFHKFLEILFKEGPGRQYVAQRNYNLSSPAWPGGQLRKLSDWSSFIEAASGMKLEMSVLIRRLFTPDDNIRKCPACKNVDTGSIPRKGRIECSTCYVSYQVTEAFIEELSDEVPIQRQNMPGDVINKCPKCGNNDSVAMSTEGRIECSNCSVGARKDARIGALPYAEQPNGDDIRLLRRIDLALEKRVSKVFSTTEKHSQIIMGEKKTLYGFTARQANDPESTSGPQPVTHAELKDDSSLKKHATLEIEEVFMCANGVDVMTLLRTSRGTLLDAARLLRSNVLVDETWSSIICRPKSKPDGPYKVYVTYRATVASSSKQDPHRPVSTQEARGVPGLMTVLNRESICIKAEPYPPKPPASPVNK